MTVYTRTYALASHGATKGAKDPDRSRPTHPADPVPLRPARAGPRSATVSASARSRSAWSRSTARPSIHPARRLGGSARRVRETPRNCGIGRKMIGSNIMIRLRCAVAAGGPPDGLKSARSSAWGNSARRVEELVAGGDIPAILIVAAQELCQQAPGGPLKCQGRCQAALSHNRGFAADCRWRQRFHRRSIAPPPTPPAARTNVGNSGICVARRSCSTDTSVF